LLEVGKRLLRPVAIDENRPEDTERGRLDGLIPHLDGLIPHLDGLIPPPRPLFPLGERPGKTKTIPLAPRSTQGALALRRLGDRREEGSVPYAGWLRIKSMLKLPPPS
jgi:hypothetical protein